MEKWKAVPDYEGIYEVSTLGRVRSLHKAPPKLLKQTFTSGYYVVHLSKLGERKVLRVHRLVALAFIPRNDEDVVDHIDTNTKNNRVDNLRWTTTKGNANNELTKQHRSEAKQGSKNPMFGRCIPENMQRLKECRQKGVRQYTKTGAFVSEYKSRAEAQRATSIDAGSIGAACIGKRKTAGGFLWVEA